MCDKDEYFPMLPNTLHTQVLSQECTHRKKAQYIFIVSNDIVHHDMVYLAMLRHHMCVLLRRKCSSIYMNFTV